MSQRPSQPARLRFAVVVWIDACAQDDERWQALDDLKKFALDPPPRFCSVGVVIAETKDHITLTRSIGLDNEDADAGLTIPRRNIIHLRYYSGPSPSACRPK